MTDAFLAGARAALAEGRAAGARIAYLKARSPSCGVGAISRRGSTTPGNGVFAEMLRRAGIEVVPREGRGATPPDP